MSIDAEDISNAVIGVSSLAAIFPAFAWPVMYHLKSGGAWRDTAVGRHTMTIALVLASLYVSAIIGFFVPPDIFRLAVRPVISVVCAIVVWQQFVVFARVLRDQTPDELSAIPRSALMTEPEGTQVTVEAPNLTDDQVAYASREVQGCDDTDPFEDTDSFREVANDPQRRLG